MEFYIYAIYDKKANLYNDLFLSTNHGTACRDFDFMNKQNPIKKHVKNDLELYCFGKFNSVSGTLEAYEKPEYITCGEVTENE